MRKLSAMIAAEWMYVHVRLHSKYHKDGRDKQCLYEL